MIDLGTAAKQKEEHHIYHPASPPADPVQAFLAAMAVHGLEPGVVDLSGNLVRFDVDKNKKGDKAGWYVFFTGEVCAGAFGNWRTGVKQDWCQYAQGQMSDAQAEAYRQMVAQAKAQRDAEETRLHAEAKDTADNIWSEASPAPAEHSYLTRKQVAPHGLKISRGDIILPLSDADGEIHNLQIIKPSGEKRFLFGGRVKGLSYTIPGNDKIILCEGYATGATIHKATGATVICALTAGNLLPVAQEARKRCPGTSIIIAGDNDQYTPGNPGLSKATEAAKAVGGTVISPSFAGIAGADPTKKYTDYNDLELLAGLAAVKNQISAGAVADNKLQPLSGIDTVLSGRLLSRPAPRVYIFNHNDTGLIPRGVVGALTATGGTGKTYFLLQMAYAAATGGNFGPIKAVKPIETLVLIGEDPQDELDRRLWDICKGQFPTTLHAASVYGQVGPLMRLEGSTPIYADAYYWLDRTIRQHPGLELLIIDPKSRFYGLDENNNDHNTQWIQALERLAHLYDLTILFSHHTGKESAGKISQNMSRGGGALIDGCRWHAGLIRMDDDTAQRYNIDNPRQYVIFDVPKGNYSEDIPSQIYFKRGEGGVLEHVELAQNQAKGMADALYEIIKLDPTQYTMLDLIKETAGKDIAQELKDRFPGFRRGRDMEPLIKRLIRDHKLFEVLGDGQGRGRSRKVLSTTKY